MALAAQVRFNFTDIPGKDVAHGASPLLARRISCFNDDVRGHNECAEWHTMVIIDEYPHAESEPRRFPLGEVNQDTGTERCAKKAPARAHQAASQVPYGEIPFLSCVSGEILMFASRLKAI